jgi:Cu(I)/Ag(I) efflux system membrane fusion protein
MTAKMPNSRVRWIVTGIVMGVVGLGAALWIIDVMAVDPASTDMDGMDMSAAGPEPAAVRLTPAQVTQFGITFATVEERPLEARVRTMGVVEADETRLVEVSAKFSGYVDRLYADYTGKSVESGSPLLDVYAPELVAAQEEVLLARELQAGVGTVAIPGVVTGPVDLVAAARRRLSLWDITEDQIDALLSDGEPSRTLSLRAPITGVVLEKTAVAGGAFQAGETLFLLADLSTVWVNVEIRESDAYMVEPGSVAVATLTAYPGEDFPGVIDFVYPTVDARTRSVRARVVLPNPGGRLRPGMFATVQVTTPRVTSVSVPTDAVVWTGERTLVFVAGEDGGIRPVDVELGATVGDHAVVLSGVSIGQRVVSSAQYLIDAEANIGAIMRSMMGMMGAGDMAGMDMGGMPGMEMPTDSGPMPPSPQVR